MNEVLNELYTRRSVRAFQDKEIKREDLEAIVKAGTYAPSGQNKQTWQFTVVTNRDKIQRLAKAVGEKLGREDYDMYSPQALMIPSNDRENPHGMEDNACALENIFLAAHALKIGSVWINQVRHVCDEPEVRMILREWGIPDDHVVYGCAALGYPACPLDQDVKKTGKVTWID